MCIVGILEISDEFLFGVFFSFFVDKLSVKIVLVSKLLVEIEEFIVV